VTGPRTAGDIVRWTAVTCGALGLVTGLVVGLFAYLPTAWFAAFEIGIPAAFAGAALGLVIAGTRWIVRRLGGRSA
jgi:uncharacterized membrane-anchored protein